jgi:sugar phosphate isomerase/epimerase
MMKVALIPNEFSMDFESVCKLCSDEGVHFLELAYMWNKSILDLEETEIQRVESLMHQYKLHAASIQTQILKVFPPDSPKASLGSKIMNRDYDYNKSRIDRAIELARRFHTPYIVSYSFFKGKHKPNNSHWQRFLKDYAEIMEKCKIGNITMVIECEGDTYISSVTDYLRFFTHFKGPQLKANLDLANLISWQRKLPRKQFELLYPYIKYFHVKDRKMGRWKILPSQPAIFGEGNVPWKEVLTWCAEKDFDGFLSIEPHVHGNDRIAQGRRCIQNLHKLLKELKIPYQ